MIINYDHLDPLRAMYGEKKIVFCSGSYDVPHLGHIFFLERAKELGDILVVTVGKDAEIRKNKGPDRPILNEQTRLKTIDSFKPVDYAFLTNRPKEGAGILGPIREILGILKPDVYVVNSDIRDIAERQAIAEEFGADMSVIDDYCVVDGEKISTTNIIQKIRSLA